MLDNKSSNAFTISHDPHDGSNILMLVELDKYGKTLLIKQSIIDLGVK
jgi:hypothetical protein